MEYKQLTIEEREQIQTLLWQKMSIRGIAKSIGRSVSTVSREISRNNPPQHTVYTPRLAHERALAYRKRRGRETRLKHHSLREYVKTKLKLRWSPEQIAATAENNIGIKISHEAIYQYIYAQVYRDGYGYLKPGKEDLRKYLTLRRKRRMRKGFRKAARLDNSQLPSIETRPKEVTERIKIGHWEDDCVVSGQSKERLKTINERVSGLVFIGKMKNGTIKESNLVVNKRLTLIPEKYRQTLTRDRGKENLGYLEIEEKLGIKCYFANAYHPWERGSNENLNGLIRRFFPKKISFKDITEEEIQKVEYLINSKPRKRLGWKTPYEVFFKLTGVALHC